MKKFLKTVTIITLLLVTCFIFEAASAEEVKAQDIVITAKAVTEVRSQPNAGAPLLGNLGAGVYLARYEMRPDGWSLIDYAGTPAYILTASLTQYGATPAAPGAVAATPATGVAAPATGSGVTVYITATGTKYHNKPNCGTTKSASAVSLEKAQAMGLQPCKKCFKH